MTVQSKRVCELMNQQLYFDAYDKCTELYDDCSAFHHNFLFLFEVEIN
jgi:hypothetical protein